MLIRDNELIRDTFTGANGGYSFAGILPGKYSLVIDEKWLPSRYTLTRASSYSIVLAPQQEIVDMNFGAVEKEKKIIRTYTAPEAESVYIENKDKGDR